MTPHEHLNAAQMRDDRRRDMIARALTLATFMAFGALFGFAAHLVIDLIDTLNRSW